jgi:uncharacterized membrane protein
VEVHVQLLHPPEELRQSRRLQSIDFLRGLVMILMALDHVREWFTNAPFSPTDLSSTTGAYFMTRWVTHFCAPVFSLLTGVGAFLWFSRGRSKAELSRFLLLRGVWLIFLEVVVTRCFGWAFNFDYRITAAAVLWVLGWSMIVLAGAVWLPMRVLTGVALLTIAGHGLLANIRGARPAWLWQILYGRGNIEFAPGHNLYVAYTVIPWFAVMMAGFSLGQVFRWEATRRARFLIRAGVAAICLFVVVRGFNGYGDPAPWAGQKSALFDVFSFVNCTKYPPSLDFLLMTLGPAMVLLGLIDCGEFYRLRPVVIFGRVPLFYYAVHIPVMHLIAVAISYAKFGSAYWFFRSASIAEFPSMRPPGWGYRLGGVYVIWIAVVAIMYPLCRWYEGVKRRNSGGWLSYL